MGLTREESNLFESFTKMMQRKINLLVKKVISICIIHILYKIEHSRFLLTILHFATFLTFNVFDIEPADVAR